MSMHSDVTQILNAIDRGDPRASEALLPLVYEELRKLANVRLSNEKTGQTLQATGLVHEAYLRLLGSKASVSPDWDGRGHFFAAAAEAMRRILIDRVRAKNTLSTARCRGGGPNTEQTRSYQREPSVHPKRLEKYEAAIAEINDED